MEQRPKAGKLKGRKGKVPAIAFYFAPDRVGRFEEGSDNVVGYMFKRVVFDLEQTDPRIQKVTKQNTEEFMSDFRFLDEHRVSYHCNVLVKVESCFQICLLPFCSD
jgi:hypothetical protein